MKHAGDGCHCVDVSRDDGSLNDREKNGKQTWRRLTQCYF